MAGDGATLRGGGDVDEGGDGGGHWCVVSLGVDGPQACCCGGARRNEVVALAAAVAAVAKWATKAASGPRLVG